MDGQDLSNDRVRVAEDEALAMGEELEEDSDLDETSVSIGLNETGHPGGYHVLNDPHAPLQRQTIIERRGAIDIRCKSREVIHGSFGPDSDDFATLLVYDFHLDATKRARRVASADITFKFRSSVAGAPAPQVHSIAPFKRYTLLPTTQEESVTRGGDVKAEAGQMGVSVGTSYKWETTVSQTTSNATRVSGNTVCDRYGKEIGVNWVLHENDATKTGVPSFLRTAILLRRVDEQPFECAVTIAVEADWKTDLTRFLGSRVKDDPILFDPTRPPTNKLRKSGYDLDDLGSIKLEEFFDITFQTTFNNAVKVHV